jgi:hypothetical protein
VYIKWRVGIVPHPPFYVPDYQITLTPSQWGAGGGSATHKEPTQAPSADSTETQAIIMAATTLPPIHGQQTCTFLNDNQQHTNSGLTADCYGTTPANVLALFASSCLRKLNRRAAISSADQRGLQGKEEQTRPPSGPKRLVQQKDIETCQIS